MNGYVIAIIFVAFFIVFCGFPLCIQFYGSRARKNKIIELEYTEI